MEPRACGQVPLLAQNFARDLVREWVSFYSQKTKKRLQSRVRRVVAHLARRADGVGDHELLDLHGLESLAALHAQKVGHVRQADEAVVVRVQNLQSTSRHHTRRSDSSIPSPL
jgi:hypothetical protein